MSRILDVDFPAKETALREWVRRKLGGVGHEQRVASIAGKLFDITHKWHYLRPVDRQLLTLAALTHDVGRAYGAKGHAKTGARMIAENTGLPLSDTERRRLCFLTRHHRRRLPVPGDEQYLERALDSVRCLRVLLGLLRAADGLDSRAGKGAHLVMTARDRRVTVFGYMLNEASTDDRLLTKRKKLELLETVLRCEVQVKWFSIDRLALLS